MSSEHLRRRQLRREREREPIHPWRWRVLALWMVVFTVAVGWQVARTRNLVRENHASIAELAHAKASVAQLQKTNCGLKRFLFAAADARFKQAKVSKREHNRLEYRANLSAARGYVVLAKRFSAVGACHIQRGGP